jgi:hypothetical protein
MPLEEQPEYCNRLLLEFLSENLPSTAPPAEAAPAEAAT